MLCTNESLIGVFPQSLNCSPRGFSETPKPDIDENCNLQWDDTAQGAKSCKFKIGNKAYGAPYICAEKQICEGMEATFSSMYAMNQPDFFKDATCTTVNFSDGISWGSGGIERIGNLGPNPNTYPSGCYKFNQGTPDSAANWILSYPDRWTDAACEYLYDKKTLYY